MNDQWIQGDIEVTPLSQKDLDDIYPYRAIKNQVVKQYESIKKQGKCLIQVNETQSGRICAKFWRTKRGIRRSYWHLMPESFPIEKGQWVVPDGVWIWIQDNYIGRSYHGNW